MSVVTMVVFLFRYVCMFSIKVGLRNLRMCSVRNKAVVAFIEEAVRYIRFRTCMVLCWDRFRVCSRVYLLAKVWE